jgi:aldose sugar dehydrogenase
MHRLLASIGLAAILVLAMQSTYNFAGAQEEDHNHAEHAAETAAGGPSVNDTNLAVEKVADGLTLPTTMAFLDENRILVLEKDNGTVRMVENGELKSEPLLDVAVANDNERGMLGIAISKENETTTYVFLYYTESGGGADVDDRHGVAPAGNRLYRYELQGDKLVNPKLLLDLPALPGPRYNGGPIALGPDNNVYVIIGDVEGHATKAQNFEKGPAADGTSGVLRVGKNGETQEPVIGTGAFGKYYFDPETGKLWDTENGPAFGDEINLVDAGFNSGWRDVQGLVPDSNLTGLVLFNARSHYSNPEFSWTEPVGPTALAFLNSSELGEDYKNDMFVGDINNGTIYHFDLNQNRSGFMLDGALQDTVADTSEESGAAVFGTGFGGVTDIKTGPDGNLYVLSFIDGTIYRIIPAGTPEENESDKANLTVNSADLSNHTITGMFTTISSSKGTTLKEGYTPLTFTGDKGSEYIVTVADFGSRHFDHWESNETTNRTRTITLDQDTTITVYYHTSQAGSNQQTNMINRLAGILNGQDCLDEKAQHKLNNAISKIIKDIFGENKGKTDQLEKTLNKIIENCMNNNMYGQQ